MNAINDSSTTVDLRLRYPEPRTRTRHQSGGISRTLVSRAAASDNNFASRAAIVEKLSAAANAALKTEQVRSALTKQGTDPLGGTPQEFADFIRADIEKWAAVLASSGPTK